MTLEPPRQGLCDEPNAEAPPNRISLFPGLAFVDGYQQYALTRHDIRCGPRHPETQAKARLLADWMTPRFLKGRDVLDLGGNAAFHSLWALQAGARSATVVDIDEGALENGRRAAQHVGLEGLTVSRSNAAEWSEPADVVLALALVHWVYSCTALFGSMSAVVERLASLTRYLALIEWVAPDDALIARCGHTQWNRESVTGPYDEGEFLDALKRSFPRVQVVGEVSPTRRVYAAFVGEGELDLSGDLALLHPPHTLMASRNISRFRGTDHWSRVYRGPANGQLTKQTSFDLAHREFVMLSRLSGPYFPRAVEESASGDSSVLVVEAIDGVPLDDARETVTASAEAFADFVGHCLNILRALRDAGIQHRDIRAENVLLRQGVPVLLDFGWAISSDLPHVTPLFLGLSGRPPDGSFCDVYSMGSMVRALKGDRFPNWDSPLRLMTEPDNRCRLTDLDALTLLADAAAGRAGSATGGHMDKTKQAGSPQTGADFSQLADKAAALSQRVASQETRIAALEQELLKRQESIDVLSARLFEGETAAESLRQQIAGRDAQEAQLRAVLEPKEVAIGELRAALGEQDRHIAGQAAALADASGHLEELGRELHGAQIALAESRGAQAAQSQQIAYLEKEVHARFWRKVVTYVRRRLRGF